ncbi:uncharacterized protein [Amphiura filiformis]|uniref:uncharacterized protein isoform X2 n=1 Tax=Amphiura filiformis TaxID=82378 RepID=UPI003B21D5FB
MDLVSRSTLLLAYTPIIILFLINVICRPNAEQVDSDKSDFNLNFEDFKENLRVKRADVSKIRHLYHEERINEHSQDEKDAILAKHIEYRSRTNPEASNMEYMYWNEELARLAGLWASVCYFGHGDTNHSHSFGSIGQNLGVGPGKPGVGTVIAWHDAEVENYNYSTGACNRACGHYKQVVWATSRELGCSRAWCSKLIDNEGNFNGETNRWIEACNYAPAGNYVGAKPFRSGPSCTRCGSGSGSCYNNACRLCSEYTNGTEECDCRQACDNCATSTSDCRCNCFDGWHGDQCSEVCENKDSKCGRSPGWPSRAYCGEHPAIPEKCPLMCGRCAAAGDEECITTAAPTTIQPTTTPPTTTQPTTTQPATTSSVTIQYNDSVTTEELTTAPSSTEVTTDVPTTTPLPTMELTTVKTAQPTTMLATTQPKATVVQTAQPTATTTEPMMLKTTPTVLTGLTTHHQTTLPPTMLQTTLRITQTTVASMQPTTFPTTQPTATFSITTSEISLVDTTEYNVATGAPTTMTMQSTTQSTTLKTTELPPTVPRTATLPTTFTATTLPTTQPPTTLPTTQPPTTLPTTKTTQSMMSQTLSLRTATSPATLSQTQQTATLPTTQATKTLSTTQQTTQYNGNYVLQLIGTKPEGKAAISVVVFLVALGVAVAIYVKVKSTSELETNNAAQV